MTSPALSLVAALQKRRAGDLAHLVVDRDGEERDLDLRLTNPARSLLPSKTLGAVLLGDRKSTPEGELTGAPGPKRFERQKITYLLPFEVVSVHLLVVLVGAAYLARAKRKRSEIAAAATSGGNG
jgi:hypothetical protein